MEENKPKFEYLAPDVSELKMIRGGIGHDPQRKAGKGQNGMTRTVARRLLPACIVVPAILWWGLIFGVHRHLYTLETCFVLFVFSVTAVFGIIVCLNLRKMSKMDQQRAQAQDQLSRAKEAAEAANQFKSMFFANISHEIRTPLTAINGFAELILNPQRTEEERQSDARIIRRNGEHLLTLINDILDLSKIEAGRMSVDPVLCCPAKIVGDVASMLRLRAADKDLTLDVSFEGPIPKLIRTDPTRLRQVLINMCSNAIKFTKRGGIRMVASIKPALQAEKPLLEIKIIDTGIGIPSDQVNTLFKPFVQGDATITRQFGGSGLGLAISQHFARALGGDITVASQAGQGSTFTVTVTTDSLIGVAMHENPEEAMENATESFATNVRISGTVLVAEDGLDNQALIATKLRETGLNVELAANGQIAFDKAVAALQNGAPYDLILMDVQMPEMDGFTATFNLRGAGYRKPIIALTANATERDRSKCLNAGCNDFVTKPIDMEKLIKAISRYMAVVKVAPGQGLTTDAAAAEAARAAKAQKFSHDIPGEIAQLLQAIDREDRQQVKDVAQLILGKATAAGLTEITMHATTLVQAVDSDQPWTSLRQTVSELSRVSQPQSQAA